MPTAERDLHALAEERGMSAARAAQMVAMTRLDVAGGGQMVIPTGCGTHLAQAVLRPQTVIACSRCSEHRRVIATDAGGLPGPELALRDTPRPAVDGASNAVQWAGDKSDGTHMASERRIAPILAAMTLVVALVLTGALVRPGDQPETLVLQQVESPGAPPPRAPVLDRLGAQVDAELAIRAFEDVDPGDPAVWDTLAGCESGGDWGANTGNGYYGGLQFLPSSWLLVGGVGLPHEAGRQEQIHRAMLLQELQGWEAWPACTLRLGYR